MLHRASPSCAYIIEILTVTTITPTPQIPVVGANAGQATCWSSSIIGHLETCILGLPYSGDRRLSFFGLRSTASNMAEQETTYTKTIPSTSPVISYSPSGFGLSSSGWAPYYSGGIQSTSDGDSQIGSGTAYRQTTYAGAEMAFDFYGKLLGGFLPDYHPYLPLS